MAGEPPGGVPAAAGPNPLRVQEAIRKPNPRARAVRHLGTAPQPGRAMQSWLNLSLGAPTLWVGSGREQQFLGEKEGGPL